MTHLSVEFIVAAVAAQYQNIKEIFMICSRDNNECTAHYKRSSTYEEASNYQ